MFAPCLSNRFNRPVPVQIQSSISQNCDFPLRAQSWLCARFQAASRVTLRRRLTLYRRSHLCRRLRRPFRLVRTMLRTERALEVLDWARVHLRMFRHPRWRSNSWRLFSRWLLLRLSMAIWLWTIVDSLRVVLPLGHMSHTKARWGQRGLPAELLIVHVFVANITLGDLELTYLRYLGKRLDTFSNSCMQK